MIKFKATIQKYIKKGEKSGWTYIEIPFDLAEKLKPETKKSFRVKGKLDKVEIKNANLYPAGEGNYILALNATLRKQLKKDKGDTVLVELSEDKKTPPLSTVFLECLEEDPKALAYFKSLPPSHQKYFSNWIESAKTDGTKTKRITQSVVALGKGLGFGEMIRMNQKNKEY